MDTITKILDMIEEKGITKSSICLKLGLANNYLAEVKKGKTKLTDKRIAMIADILGTSPAYLKGEQEDVESNFALDLNNLFLRIDRLGLNAKKVADDTGISTGNISDWKTGRSMPSAANLNILASYLDCSVDFLIGRTNNPKSIPHYDPSRNGAVDAKNAYQVYLADILHNSVTKATHQLSERNVRVLNGYIQVAILGRPIEQVKLENDELLIVEALIEAPVKIKKAPSEDGAILSVAARGTPVADEQFDKLVNAEETLERSTD